MADYRHEQAIDTIAREALRIGHDVDGVLDAWPDFTHDDTRAVLSRLNDLKRQGAPSEASVEAAYAYLKRRAEAAS